MNYLKSHDSKWQSWPLNTTSSLVPGPDLSVTIPCFGLFIHSTVFTEHLLYMPGTITDDKYTAENQTDKNLCTIF